MEWIRNLLGYEGMVVVESQGRSGGLALMWKEENQASLRSRSNNHIDVETKVNGMSPWRLTGLYGEPNRNHRRKTWDLLRNLARDSNLPWCTIGDLNNTLSHNDKRGGAQYPNHLIEGFTESILDAGLTDMPLEGHQFTWEKGRNTDNWMETRLDRALVNTGWLNLFPVAKLYNMEGSPSDHSPIHLSLKNGVRFRGTGVSGLKMHG